jgi:2-methylcitrate dehydratase PrpD
MTQPDSPVIAGVLADWASELSAEDVPVAVRKTLRRVVLDVGGLMVAARHAGYVQACVESSAATGGTQTATAIGHAGRFTAGDAALISGTAAHGEDFDDTFEGTPVHVGAVLVPALLAIGEAEKLSGPDILRGFAVGGEIACRMAVVAPTAIHRAAFHPTAVIGAVSAAAGVSSALRLTSKDFQSALGIVGSMASGLIEYLAEGTSTKRLHPGWAAQSGIRAARLARAGFDGPRTVFEGEHGFFKAFADPSIERDFDRLTNGLGTDWLVEGLAFKPYACGTMVQPFIDCAIELRRSGIEPDDISAITARVGEGTVHRLWEPLAVKRRPTTPYSAKFSGPFGIAIGLVEGAGGLDQFTEQCIRDPSVLAVTSKIDFEIDPENPYPGNYTGELVVTLSDGTKRHLLQPHLRGGRRESLGLEELVAKYRANAAFGGWSEDRAEAFRQFAEGLFEAEDLGGLAAFAG